jgi:hypothetical protein
MDKRQQRTLQSFQHVFVFLEQHPIKPELPLLTRMEARLRELRERIRKLSQSQRNPHLAAGVTAKNVRHGRTTIRREMMALVRIAGPMLRFAHGEESLRVPHARASAETVANAAMALADALEPHGELLKDAGYSREFMRDFRAQAKVLTEWESGALRARNERSIATREIAEAFKEAMETLTVIEGLVMRAFAHQPQMMRLWRNRRRVQKRMGRPKTKRRTAASSSGH